MLAIVGGNWLSGADLPPALILSQFVLVVAGMDFVMSSMTAKYAVLSPVFVPMFMKAGISPELTQASYRIADSTSNVITPVNAYLVIILACIQRYIPRAGLGTLISLMLPYSVVFLIVWIGMLVMWIQLGWPLGPDAPLVYPNR
jgi:aminobenzoyl-glutamate transport protein